MDESLAIPTSAAPATREATLALHLSKITPFRVIRLFDRTIYRFWKIGCKDNVSMSTALHDPAVPRQTAYIVAFRDRDTFQMGYARDGENSQTVYDLPLERLGEAIADLRAAGF